MSNQSDPVDADGQRAWRIHEIVNDCLLRRSRGEVVTDHSIIEAHADLMPELAERLRSLHLIQEAEHQFLQPPAGGLRIGCPFCHNPLEIVEEASLSDVVCPSCGSQLNLVEEADGTFQASRLQQLNHLQLLDKLGVGASGVADNETSGATQTSPGDPDASLLVDAVPASSDVGSSGHYDRIGRYRIEKVLGKGGFGLVYLAHDEQLDRPVALKVPHTRLISRPEDAEAYRAEARTVANLDHPNIVPVHDVGSTKQCPCFVVSKFVEGNDLSKKLKRHRLKPTEAAELVATVAEALHYAHKQGLVHRDVKPGNILIGKDGKPYVVDFGLALREENIGKGPKYAGTPAYMSPEQARGEGHRVDGRSDIYSLGAVFYELLTGRRTFSTDTENELLDQIASQEVKPPRQIDDAVPKELERICLKALSKRATERHTTALDMAEDLRHFLQQQPACSTAATASPESAAPCVSDSTAVRADAETAKADSDSQPIRIVPKGLRSFDEHDADFFLELLPGPRDREELPDSIRFWKTRIEETDADKTFSVGLIYGPSGCGKSSLVRAGLLPRLSDDVFPVYVEATPEETETRLLRGLRKRCPALEENLSLKETLAALRRGEGIPVGKKLLIVLDQFEQWLHAEKGEENTDLVQALRQCDGSRVQCLVLVRDDFWMAATRFMRELEIRLVEADNSAAVDLFPVRFAEKVLAAFGRAFGVLPDRIGETSQDQKAFLQQSVAGLAGEGKVICVRLALFAEMMKGRSWTPATLKEVGGAKGVGFTFLEETFSASTAPPEHRYRQKAARAVLKALLPEFGTDIKGQMKSYDQLLEASGCARRPQDFENLIRILDREIRLITPTDHEGLESDDDFASGAEVGQKYYQLTHDYLVHSLRDWLTRKQRETRRGRAELRLSERAALWEAKPKNRHLPAWWEFLNILCLTHKRSWRKPQRKMMRQAGNYHAVRMSIGLLFLGFTATVGFTIRSEFLEQGAQQRALRAITKHLKVLNGNEVRLRGASLTSINQLVPHLQVLGPIELLDLSNCVDLSDLRGLASLASLQTLYVAGCERLESLEGLSELTNLRTLSLSGCQTITEIGQLKELRSLETLSLRRCSKLSDVTVLRALVNLRELDLSGLTQLSDVRPLAGLTDLRKLDLSNCPDLRDVSGVSGLSKLASLTLSETRISDLDQLKGLTNLEILDLNNCSQLRDVSSVSGLSKLTSLSLSGTRMSDLNQLKGLTNLEILDLSYCYGLSSVRGVGDLKTVTELRLDPQQAEKFKQDIPNGTKLVIVRLAADAPTILKNVPGLKNMFGARLPGPGTDAPTVLGNELGLSQGTNVTARNPMVHDTILRGRRLGQVPARGD